MSYSYTPTHCMLCPRECGVDRTQKAGACGGTNQMQIAKVMLHRYEEPPISGTRGSGAIFFSGCNLHCGYCQNAPISHGQTIGDPVFPAQLAEQMLALQEQGAHNINLVTAAHYVPYVAESLRMAKAKLHIPVVYNSSGYEKAEALQQLSGLVDIYLPDFKYIDPDAAARYSGAKDYPQVVMAAIAEMVRQTGEYIERDGIAVRGTVIRHLVLPGQSHAGERIMRTIAAHFPASRVSIMRQYTPSFNKTGDPSLDRRVTTLEYNRVLSAAADCGLQGFMQGRDSATEIFTPDFNNAEFGIRNAK